MRAPKVLLTLTVSIALSGCLPSNEPRFSSRGTGPEQISVHNASNEIQMQQQAAALNAMTRNIIRKSTVKGAAIGAFAGCGLVLLSATNAKNCVSGAIAGGAIGAVAGAASGKAKAAKRVELVSPSSLVRAIGKADDNMDIVSRDLPNLLKKQDTELALLNDRMKSGQIDEEQYAYRFEIIKANRAQLAEALSLSAAQANEAHRNLLSAQSKGQSGLDWHLNATRNLARDATSARSAISLL